MSANNIQDILRLGGGVFKTELAKKFDEFNLNATGRTLRSIDPQVIGNRLTIFGADHIQTVQDGRPPTKKSGNGELIAAIKEWAAAKNIKVNVYAVTKKIHKEGTRLWRGEDPRFTKPTDVLQSATEKTMTYIQKEATELLTVTAISTFVNAFKTKPT